MGGGGLDWVLFLNKKALPHKEGRVRKLCCLLTRFQLGKRNAIAQEISRIKEKWEHKLLATPEDKKQLRLFLERFLLPKIFQFVLT